MLIPSMSLMLVGLAFAAVLMAVDWYVWGVAYRGDFRLPHRVTPLGAADIVDPLLGRMIDANQAILPKAVVESCNAKRAAVVQEREGGDFKKVA
jgi:hypothetical protein